LADQSFASGKDSVKKRNPSLKKLFLGDQHFLIRKRDLLSPEKKNSSQTAGGDLSFPPSPPLSPGDPFLLTNRKPTERTGEVRSKKNNPKGRKTGFPFRF